MAKSCNHYTVVLFKVTFVTTIKNWHLDNPDKPTDGLQKYGC